MNILVTAGNTLVPIDRVRCITNIFTGKTGASIALAGHARGHTVTLLTSHPEAMAELHQEATPPNGRWTMRRYTLFEELRQQMASLIEGARLDAIIHCAAVSDYLAEGVYAPAPGSHFDADTGAWRAGSGPPRLIDRQALKVKSDEPELWLRLVRAPKLIDQIRSPWGFRGLLVKFKLEVGTTEELLLQVAEASRQHSQADLMVANTLEDSAHSAYLGPLDGGYQKVSRRDLAACLIQVVERLQEVRGNG
jgi:phosphopantothenoylcysteine synthetase/decarboxylase